jgi:hypothetical protein
LCAADFHAASALSCAQPHEVQPAGSGAHIDASIVLILDGSTCPAPVTMQYCVVPSHVSFALAFRQEMVVDVSPELLLLLPLLLPPLLLLLLLLLPPPPLLLPLLLPPPPPLLLALLLLEPELPLLPPAPELPLLPLPQP